MTRLQLEDLVIYILIFGFTQCFHLNIANIDIEKLRIYIHTKTDEELLHVLDIAHTNLPIQE